MNLIRFSQCAVLMAAIAVGSGCAMNSANAPLPQTNAVTPSVSKAASKHIKTFRYTGKVQTFVVPAHVTSLAVIALGAAGGGKTCTRTSCYRRDLFGRGGRIYALLPVRPREELYVFVGGKGTSTRGGFNGGGNPGSGGGSYGGGGASDIRSGLHVNKRVIVGAGGGGQGSSNDSTGGGGGGKFGDAGGTACYTSSDCPDGGGGQGAGSTYGGAGGFGGMYYATPGQPGGVGIPGVAGNGGAAGCYNTSSPCNCGRANGCPGAGGGGGYYGGGGGGGGAGLYTSAYGGAGGGGGGGSSWAEPHAVNVKTWSGWKTATDDGLVVIKWQ